ncbi:unnamed protein product, partial [Ectocarpus sp. 13 AM-2016]
GKDKNGKGQRVPTTMCWPLSYSVQVNVYRKASGFKSSCCLRAAVVRHQGHHVVHQNTITRFVWGMTIHSSYLGSVNGEPRPHDAVKQARRHAPHEPRTPCTIHPSLRSPFTSFVLWSQSKHHLFQNHFFYDAPPVSD